ncbi:dienelactone hydrolase family protein [Nocardia cyriacigeorgica]|uniref:dienelactone hydrolase family protein n=1 Tax=Nocardia cyriacigeorgica TaxID=135487 RepID=UPI0018930DE4|nr:dienelactone hydrolase family protein [Nocardia cyriacigeorgica]MBF6320282.1 dienelactone hydrolase family protein [Nocardia cyriacigeorgica]MBF6534232.1 dienelactone hydrolase family protein [Nocardia cyriacigeorgica]
MFVDEEVRIPLGEVGLEGQLCLPRRECGVVVFAHGSGSGRHSPRNRHVAAVLRSAGLGTVLLDLLTAAEEDLDRRTRELRFDITLLAGRLAGTVDWLAGLPATGKSPIGLFGASTGAAAALRTAADRPAAIRAVVSRGGRPDLAGDALRRVRAPTLLIVGGEDGTVLDLNGQAMGQLTITPRLEIIPGATHLFEEPGTLDQAAELAAGWFVHHLGAAPAVPPAL